MLPLMLMTLLVLRGRMVDEEGVLAARRADERAMRCNMMMVVVVERTGTCVNANDDGGKE